MIQKTILSIFFSLSIGSVAYADYDHYTLDSLNRRVATAAAAKDYSVESRARLDRICFFYNYDLNDSLYAHAQEDMDFNREHGFWDNFYETWEHKANDLIFSGKVNTGLRELQQMHKVALEHDHVYGLCLAYYGMGNAYISMEHFDEAEENYEMALKYVSREQKVSRTMTLDLYSYYCDALNEKRAYDKMLKVLPAWKKVLEEIQLDNGDSSAQVWYAYYYLACAQAHIGLKHYVEAKMALDEVYARSHSEGNFIYLSHLYYRAQLFYCMGEYAEALKLNTERIAKSEEVNDVSSPVMIHRQRAEILKAMGRYREAADAYLKMYQLKDSLDNRQLRDQASELTTLYRVEELAREKEMTDRQLDDAKRLGRTRIMAVVAFLIGISLLVFVVYWYITSRRLRRKNEELVIAHQQAQESSLMKTKFIQNMSHEIRTPLNIIGGFSQVLAQNDADIPLTMKREASEKILENADRITSIIGQLIVLSELDSRTVIEQNDTISVSQLCSRVIDESGVGKNLDYHFLFVSELAGSEMITTSVEHFVQSVVPLLDNAMKFSPKGGKIRFVCKRQGTNLQIEIENTVLAPIPPSEAERIFEPFAQLNEYSYGVGVGLSVSRSVLRRLGGDVRFDSKSSDVARFIVTLPMRS